MASTQTQPLSDAVSREIAHFKDQADGWALGTVPDNEFKPFRLVHGIYGQRQKGVQMVRVKIPGGQLNPAQVRVLGELARDFAPRGIGHFTTRQNVQFHFVPLDKVPALMEKIESVDLTTREACGNAIRNITASPVSGIAGDEIFDAYPYAKGAFRYFLRRAEFSNLPRKFKMSFNGSPRDYAQAAINDIGFFSQVRIVDGKPVRGFRLKVGGGLGSSPQDAWLYADFIPVDEVLPHVEAILKHFDQAGERKNRMAARIKYLIRKEGIEKFREEVAKIHATLPKQVPFPVEPQAAEPQAGPGGGIPDSGAEGFADWVRLNTWPQKQKGFRYAVLKLRLGDLTSQQFFFLADAAERFGNGELRTSNDQNLLLPWVAEEKLADLHAELKKWDLAELGPDLIGDVTSCPGADTCNLGLVSSRGLGKVLTDTLAYKKEGKTDLNDVHIKISGCPNSCGQHHVASIGFFGAVRKVGGQDSPHFNLLLGGGIDENGAKFGRLITKVPSRRVPRAVELIVDAYRRERAEGESFVDWSRRADKAQVARLLEPLTEITSGDPELLKDNGSDEPFKLEGLGASECA